MTQRSIHSGQSPRAAVPLPLALRHRFALMLVLIGGGAVLFTMLSSLPSLTYPISLLKKSGWQEIQSPVSEGGQTPSSVSSATPVQIAVKKVSASLLRLSQNSIKQYASKQEHETWWASSCSAAAMAMIINAYKGTTYRVRDILSVERSFVKPQVISVEKGLLYSEGIARTMGYYGFVTSKLSRPTIEELITHANAGTPVLVNFPPSRWRGGHFVVVKGGSATHIEVVDSSQVNLGTLTHQQFAALWLDFAMIFAPAASSVLGKPTLTVPFINEVLAAYHSPASGRGQALYDLGVRYQVNPAVALAFFLHESTMGTQGVALLSRSLGNLRCVQTGYEDLFPRCQDGYTYFPSWEAGFEAFFRLISGPLYAASGLVTAEQIIPKYAPAADHNDEQAYIRALLHALDTWHSGKLKPEPHARVGSQKQALLLSTLTIPDRAETWSSARAPSPGLFGPG